MEITESIRQRPRPSESTGRHGQSWSRRARTRPCCCQGLRLKGRAGCQGRAQARAVCLLSNHFFSCLCFSCMRYSAAWQSWVP